MVKIESTTNSRIPFSQRLFWSIFAMFLGFTACFLLFQYQREREFAQEKLNNVLGNYNYQLFRRTQQTEDINQVVHQFIDDIPQKDSTTITTAARYARHASTMKGSPSVRPTRPVNAISTRRRISAGISTAPPSPGTLTHSAY